MVKQQNLSTVMPCYFFLHAHNGMNTFSIINSEKVAPESRNKNFDDHLNLFTALFVHSTYIVITFM